MKAQRPLSNELKKRIKDKAKEDALEAFRGYKHAYYRRLYKVFCIALNMEFGFGEDRLKRVLETADKLFSEYGTDEIYWEHVDRYLERFNLGFEKEDYNDLY